VRGLRKGRFPPRYVLDGVEEIQAAVFEREGPWNDARGDRGPDGIAGDAHGWFDGLCRLLGKLGREASDTGADAGTLGGRRVIFPGGLAGRGRYQRPS
jgi:hypothetical protein